MFGVGVSAGLPSLLQQVSLVQTAKALEGKAEKHPNRILVVVEMAGGNDGLNTVVPYGDDAYYKARPRIAINKERVLKIDDHFGFHPSCLGMNELYHDGKMAIVHGCGYPDPNLSHFTAMEWWHTAVPHGSDKYGWIGRFVDAYQPEPVENYLVNINTRQSLAVNSAKHSPVTFKDPRRFRRFGTPPQQKVFEEFGKIYPTTNPSLGFLNQVSQTATAGAAVVRGACAEYRTMVEYGSDNELTLDLKKVAAMLNAGLPTRIFYLSMGGFDTHAAQEQLQNLLLIYFSDALRGFFEDLARIGRADDVAMMIFTEFGRRVNDNASGGTDHGTATPMYIIGNKVKGGLYGEFPSLTDLDSGNLKMTCDFRRVYATMMNQWMGFEDTNTILKGDYPPVAGVFG
jgi:uncharacterized protein (DUF1501 family)